MERVIERVVALIEHLSLESQGERTRCFYCGRSHKTVRCTSPKKEAFLLSLNQLAAVYQEEELSLQEQELPVESSECLPRGEQPWFEDQFTASFESESELYEYE